MKTNSGFDLLAPVYDSLARFVFGRNIIDSQVWFLDQVPPDSSVLILGGGTGWIIEELQNRNQSATVYYVELSSAMIQKARHRKLRNPAHFIQGTEEAIPPHLKFDVVITNFYLDLFSDKRLSQVAHKIHSQTTERSVWLITDFANSTWWHRWMLKSMYLFFRIVCKIDATQLPTWSKQLQDHGWREVDSKRWYRDFIVSSVWHRL